MAGERAVLNGVLDVLRRQELDWLIYFPSEGNKGKYCGYTVLLNDRKREGQHKECVTLGYVLERPEVEEHYPHTVGFFKAPCDEPECADLRYMEIRTLHNVDEFWLFLNALNL